MDALPLFEETRSIAHISKYAGFHHACGHDGHSTMLAGALLDLHENRDAFSGTVIGLFQPAEETGDGAKQMLEAGIPTPTCGAYGLHNIPGQPLGQIMLKREGVAARASCGLRLHLQGVASHASEPAKGINPAFVLASLLHSGRLTDLPTNLLASGAIGEQIMGGAVLATPVHLRVGKDLDFGILPADAVINITLRADTTTDVEILQAHVEVLCCSVLNKIVVLGACYWDS
jgi:metal-dependent amidase/aminoacylase/carboxypeptidase family protein